MYCIKWNINFSISTVLIHNDRHNIARQCNIKMKRNFLELLIFTPQFYDDKFIAMNKVEIDLDEGFNTSMTILEQFYKNHSKAILVWHAMA